MVNIAYHEKKAIALNSRLKLKAAGYSRSGDGIKRQEKNKAAQLWAEDEEIFLTQATIAGLSAALPASLSQPRAGAEATVIQGMAHGNEPVALLIAQHHFSE